MVGYVLCNRIIVTRLFVSSFLDLVATLTVALGATVSVDSRAVSVDDLDVEDDLLKSTG